eukprot:c27409_g2_i5 orf=793-1047(+)
MQKQSHKHLQTSSSAKAVATQPATTDQTVEVPYQQICSFSYCFRTMPDAILQEVKEVDPETMVEARPVPSLVNATSTKLDRSIS